MSYFSDCVIALRNAVNKKIDTFENNTPEVVRNYLKELGCIALYKAIFGNFQNYHSYQAVQNAIICYEIPKEDYTNTSWWVHCDCAKDARNRKDSREKALKEQYKILFDLNTSASRKTFEQILARDNEWSIANKELISRANIITKSILHDACGVRKYHFY